MSTATLGKLHLPWRCPSSRKFSPFPLWGTTVRSHTLGIHYIVMYTGVRRFDRIPSLKPLVRQRHGTYEVSLKSRIKIPLGFKIFDFTLDAANRACFGASGCHYFWADMLPDRYGRITSITPLLTLSIIAEKHYETNTLQMLHIPKRRSLRNCKFQCPIRGTKGSYVFRCPSRSTQNRRCRTKGFQKSR